MFYQDSMHPWIKSDRPGKCTVCEMALTPIYEGQQGFGADRQLVLLNSNGVTVLDVQTIEVTRQPLIRTLRVAGTLEAKEGRYAVLSAPGPGRIDALTVEHVGVDVGQSQPLISFFSPDYAQTRRYLQRAALAQAGMSNRRSPAVVNAEPFSSDLLAPLSGTVIERPVFSGQHVAEGEKLLTIADLSVLWFRFDAYEQQLPWLEPGQKITVVVPAVPGKVFPAAISLLEPILDQAARTVKVRADVTNLVTTAHGRLQRLLRIGMYAEGRVTAQIPDILAVPRTAILDPGGEACVYVEKARGVYERRAIKLGRQGDTLCEVLSGLDEGEPVVVSGNVLIDAQAQLASTPPPRVTGASQ